MIKGKHEREGISYSMKSLEYVGKKGHAVLKSKYTAIIDRNCDSLN